MKTIQELQDLLDKDINYADAKRIDISLTKACGYLAQLEMIKEAMERDHANDMPQDFAIAVFNIALYMGEILAKATRDSADKYNPRHPEELAIDLYEQWKAAVEEQGLDPKGFEAMSGDWLPSYVVPWTKKK